MIDREGRFIGLACFVGHRYPWGLSSGVGFAAELNKIREVLPALVSGKSSRGMPVLGVSSRGGSLTIEKVSPGSAAEGAGILAGDRIISVDGKTLKGWGDLVKAIRIRVRGATIVIELVREGRKLTVEARL